jgi:two-component system, chemotaxis family, protein-glutamate methylesterase/glutaminase
MKRDLVVIGASAGGIDALRALLPEIPRDFPAAICAVLHMAPNSPGILHEIFGRAGKLPAKMVTGVERLRPGQLYLPAPDHHLIVEPSLVRSTQGPRENRFRPAIDPLFRSAAQTYGPRVIGIILTGGLDDGTAGLWTIKQMGGIAIVQDPTEALVASMPQNALHHVSVDHCVPLAAIPELLARLVAEDLSQREGYTVPEPVNIEVKIAKDGEALEAGVMQLGKPSQYACPECHGVLLELKEGDRLRFRCHTGHAYSVDSLLSEFDEAMEIALWNSIRAIEEKLLLLRQLADRARAREGVGNVEDLERRVEEAHRRVILVRQAIDPRNGAPQGA